MQNLKCFVSISITELRGLRKETNNNFSYVTSMNIFWKSYSVASLILLFIPVWCEPENCSTSGHVCIWQCQLGAVLVLFQHHSGQRGNHGIALERGRERCKRKTEKNRNREERQLAWVSGLCDVEERREWLCPLSLLSFQSRSNTTSVIQTFVA